MGGEGCDEERKRHDGMYCTRAEPYRLRHLGKGMRVVTPRSLRVSEGEVRETRERADRFSSRISRCTVVGRYRRSYPVVVCPVRLTLSCYGRCVWVYFYPPGIPSTLPIVYMTLQWHYMTLHT